MRIAIVSPYSWTYGGGVNRHVEALACELIDRDHELRVLAPWDPPDRLSRLIHRAAPEVRAVYTHLEPLTEPAPGRVVVHDAAEIERAVESVTGRRPRELRTLVTDDGLVVLVTLGLEGGVSLADAHDEATAVSERIRAALPGVADVVVHTEP